jgi:hypothetical protein
VQRTLASGAAAVPQASCPNTVMAMKSRLIFAAALLSMLGACVAGPDGPGGSAPAYYTGSNSGYYRNTFDDSTFYSGRYDSDANNHYGRSFQSSQ